MSDKHDHEEAHRLFVEHAVNATPDRTPPVDHTANATAQAAAKIQHIEARLASIEDRLSYVAVTVAAFIKNAGHLARQDPQVQDLRSLPEDG